MTVSQLKSKVEQAGKSPHFFTRSTMQFFGDTMRSNYGVCGPYPIKDTLGAVHEVYELYRRKPVKHGLHDSAWFDAQTFERIHPDRSKTL